MLAIIRCGCTRILCTVVCNLWYSCRHILYGFPQPGTKYVSFSFSPTWLADIPVGSQPSPLSCLMFVLRGCYEIFRGSPNCSISVVTNLGTWCKWSQNCTVWWLFPQR